MQTAAAVPFEVFSNDEMFPSESTGYLARQPILDRRGTVFGYELHFHGPIQTPGPPPRLGDARQRTSLCDSSHGLLDALAIYGVDRFTSGSRAFLNCTPDLVTDGVWEGLPSPGVVLEVPASAETNCGLASACRRLRDAGFQLALAGFDSTRSTDDLLGLIDFVKVDARVLDSPDWDRICRKLFGAHTTVVADKVHTHDSYRKARALGIRYFQGYYFCNPEFLPSGKIPADKSHQIQILRYLFADPLDLRVLCPLVMADPSLVYRVLRFVNSPLCALHEPVTSIESALIILGDNSFRRIATLAIQCSLAQGQTPELLNMALVRARFCASAAPLSGLDPDEQYLLGMLSLLPPMLQIPMASIVAELPLRPEMRDALAGHSRQERALLAWIEHLEENNIAACEVVATEYRLDRDKLADLYWKAVEGNPNLPLSE